MGTENLRGLITASVLEGAVYVAAVLAVTALPTNWRRPANLLLVVGLFLVLEVNKSIMGVLGIPFWRYMAYMALSGVAIFGVAEALTAIMCAAGSGYSFVASGPLCKLGYVSESYAIMAGVYVFLTASTRKLSED